MSWQSGIPLLSIVPLFIMLGLLIWRKRRLDADLRREAITTELRNLPASSLQKQRDDFVERQVSRMFAAVIIGASAAGIFSSRRVSPAPFKWDWLDTVALLTIIGCGLYYGWLMIRELPQGRKLRQAIRAEQATAQELAASLAGDNRIIHDVQAGDFNIDHFVITPAGVFSVETKSRLKPPVGNGSPRVKYNGKQLEFPGWMETKPIDQAARQAKWLADYLQKATGERFPVFAVLALPGWYIDYGVRMTEQMVRVINPKNSGWLLLPGKQPTRLEPPAIQRTAFQIEKLAQVAAPE